VRGVFGSQGAFCERFRKRPFMNSPIAVAGYLALFVGLGFLFLFGNLVLGWLLRPKLPNQEKLEVYECGEPTIGSSFVQFDLRFYVVALLFIIFDVEVAFFFPWATVFGKATHLMDPNLAKVQATASGTELTPAATQLYHELGVAAPTVPATDVLDASAAVEATAVLLVGFAYVWRRGDLDWVRAISRDRAQPAGPLQSESEMALSA
jgi:NADH-quinone oxidoreductase subunit A